MTAQRWPEDVGSVAEEAGRLLESLRRAGADAASSAADRPHEDDPGSAPRAREDGFTCDDPVCQWCPVCRASALVRGLSPETLGSLAELAGFAAAVLGDLASARAREERPEGPDEGAPRG
ncbi:hypothetical protein JQN72_07270 [Phycicoccus sp. CSK15P-2]|uniref:hypothetical protein n=1 Tax=Phycicoccus sp. CSK15P-2 TaxID=2807627 RepID=UPI001951CC22|nr:hypothetical protein [Phycicoccus sp. CSK15P-2]MBM6404040.1 hypothetical protein [Phycicoccus sp. CSK15P-2]